MIRSLSSPSAASACPHGSYPDSGAVYELLGGAPVLHALVTRFYEIIDTLPEARAARRLYPESMQASAERLFCFLSGWLGGPDLYVLQHGQPRLHVRHQRHVIGRAERDIWMHCMRQALHDCVPDPCVRQTLDDAFDALASYIMNSGDEADRCCH